MRNQYILLFSIYIVILCACIITAKNSKREIRKQVMLLEFSLLFPIAGNLLVLNAESRNFALIGYYIYFIGMDFLFYSMIRFSVKYCIGVNSGQTVPFWVYGLLGVDTVQLLLNPVFGHCFTIEETELDGRPYYKFVSFWGQNLHRVIDYLILLMLVIIFTIIVKRMPRIYTEKYLVILVSMVVAGIWQAVYFFSRSPINRSITALFGFGMFIFYFSLLYRPVRLLDRMLSSIASELSEALYMFDVTGKCIWANEKGCEMAECSENNYENVGPKLIELFGTPQSADAGNKFQRMVSTAEGIRYYQLEEYELNDDDGRVNGSYISVRDITEEKMRIKRELHEAIHDRLTGLYTREYLFQRISEKLENEPDGEFIIIFVDVKNFKIVNDIFGSDFGDYALQCIAKWLKEWMADDCLYGRLAGDTFGACIPANKLDEYMLEEELSHFVVRKDNAAYQLLIHLGIYNVENKEKEISLMFDRAHLSLSTIQDEYNTHIAYYDNQIRSKVMWNQSISTQLSDAIRTNQVRPYLQPIADRSGKIVGAEALARWIHPEYGFMSPSSFIPTFEKNGMIVEVDRHMWRCACEVLARWKEEKRDLFISVNISPKDFYFMDVPAEIKQLVKEAGISPEKLRVEITETVMMNESDKRMQVLDDLRRAGFIVEMDDFGSGYSSLNMLKDMPVDVLKIDMKFLGKTSDISRAHTIVKNIINLSEELGISSLTEGVEAEEQYLTLKDMGCRMFQGYYFAKPMPVEEFEELLSQKAL